jgi:hypothetical protein
MGAGRADQRADEGERMKAKRSAMPATFGISSLS